MRKLTFFTGPMSCEKSTAALRMSKRLQRLGSEVILVRPKISLREQDKPGLLVTKNGETFKSEDLNFAEDIKSLLEKDVIWIDEPILFEDEEKLFDIIQEKRKTSEIIISSLSMDAELNPFKISTPKLLAVADFIFQFKADCDRCKAHNTATRTLLCSDKTVSNQVLVGDKDVFMSTCAECYTDLISLRPENRKIWIKP